MPRLLHILPHPGGGGERVVDLLCTLDEFEHVRCHLAAARSPLAAAPSLVRRLPRVRRAAAEADLVHVVGDAAAVLALGAMRRRRSVWGTHGLHLLRRSRGPAGAVVRRRVATAVKLAERTLCSSASELEQLRALVGDEGSAGLAEIPNGVRLPDLAERDAVRATTRAELGLSEGQVGVLYAGELESRKQPLLAVEAALAAVQRGAPLVLLVAGAGPLAGEVQRRAGPSVRPLGFRDDPERLLAAADLFVMPSEREGLSLAVLEAMAHGLAVVVSDGPGNPDAVGDAGVVHPVGDLGALTDALVRLGADPAERARLGAAARERARERFTVERFLADMRRELHAALGP